MGDQASIEPEGGEPSSSSTDITPSESSPLSKGSRPSLVSEFMARFGTQHPTSIIDKATPEQLDRLIDQANEAERNEARNQRHLNNLTFALFFAIIGGVVTLCWLFLHYQKSESLEQIVALLVGLGGGTAGGYGLGRASAQKPRD